jgi:hypothetical protein
LNPRGVLDFVFESRILIKTLLWKP